MTAPANDLIADVEVIDLSSGTFTAPETNNAEATNEAFEDADPLSFPGSYSIWYRIDVTSDILLSLDPSGTLEVPFVFQLFIGPVSDDLNQLVQINDATPATDIPIDAGSTLWIRFASQDIGVNYNFTVTSTAQQVTGNAFSDPLDLLGEEGTLEIDPTGATLDSSAGTPSGVTRTLWGIWAPPSEDISRERFRITSGSATLRLYSYDSDTSTTTQLVESTVVPTDIMVTDLESGIEESLDYMLQIGFRDSDTGPVTLEWFSGEPSDYNDFDEALEIDPVFGSQVLSLLNNTLEYGESAPSGVESTGWAFFTAEEDQILNFDVVGDLDEPYTVNFYSGTALGSLTLLDTIESFAGEDVIFYEAISAGTTYYLQFCALDDFINFDVSWFIEGEAVDPYVDPAGGDEAQNDDTSYEDVVVAVGNTYTPGYSTNEPDEESEF